MCREFLRRGVSYSMILSYWVASPGHPLGLGLVLVLGLDLDFSLGFSFFIFLFSERTNCFLIIHKLKIKLILRPSMSKKKIIWPERDIFPFIPLLILLPWRFIESN